MFVLDIFISILFFNFKGVAIGLSKFIALKKYLHHIFNVAFILFLLFSLNMNSYAQSSSDSLNYNIEKKIKSRTLHGKASFYSGKFEGRKTANGEIFSQNKKTAACNKLPLGTWVLITNQSNYKSEIVKINDRLHAKNKRLIDVASSVAKKLDFYKKGLANVTIKVVSKS